MNNSNQLANSILLEEYESNNNSYCDFNNYSYYMLFTVTNFNNLCSDMCDFVVENLFDSKVKCLTIPTFSNLYIITASDEKELLDIQKLEEFVKKNRIDGCNSDSILLYSDLIFSYSDLSKTLKQFSKNVLRTIESNPKSNTIKVKSKSPKSTMVSPYQLDSFIHLFEAGDLNNLDIQIDIVVEEIRKANYLSDNKSSPTSIKRFFVELITFISHSAYDYGVDVDTVLDYDDPYHIIFAMDETPKIKEWFMNSCRKLYSACQSSVNSNKESLINAVERYVKDNISNVNFGVSDIADAFNLSVAYLSSCYSVNRGNTIINYITQQRMISACRYLENSSLTIYEIAQKTGYSSERYFYKVFKQQQGITPSQYRKKVQSNIKNVEYNF